MPEPLDWGHCPEGRQEVGEQERARRSLSITEESHFGNTQDRARRNPSPATSADAFQSRRAFTDSRGGGELLSGPDPCSDGLPEKLQNTQSVWGREGRVIGWHPRP